MLLNACGLAPAPSARLFPEIGVTHRPAEVPSNGAISPEAALARLRLSGVVIPRDPDPVQYGVAKCATGVVVCTVRIAGARETERLVWLIEWTRAHPAPEYGVYFVDAFSAAVLGGVGGDESATPVPRDPDN